MAIACASPILAWRSPTHKPARGTSHPCDGRTARVRTEAVRRPHWWATAACPERGRRARQWHTFDGVQYPAGDSASSRVSPVPPVAALAARQATTPRDARGSFGARIRSFRAARAADRLAPDWLRYRVGRPGNCATSGEAHSVRCVRARTGPTERIDAMPGVRTRRSTGWVPCAPLASSRGGRRGGRGRRGRCHRPAVASTCRIRPVAVRLGAHPSRTHRSLEFRSLDGSAASRHGQRWFQLRRR